MEKIRAFFESLPHTLRAISEELGHGGRGPVQDIQSLTKGIVEIGWSGSELQKLHYPKLWPIGVMLAHLYQSLQEEVNKQ